MSELYDRETLAVLTPEQHREILLQWCMCIGCQIERQRLEAQRLMELRRLEADRLVSVASCECPECRQRRVLNERLLPIVDPRLERRGQPRIVERKPSKAEELNPLWQLDQQLKAQVNE